MVYRVEVEVSLEGLRALRVVEPRRPAVLIRRLRGHQVPHPAGTHLCSVRVRVLPPVEVEARRVIISLDRDYCLKAVRVAQSELQRDLPTEGGAHEDGVLKLQSVAQGDDEGGVVVGGELVLFLPPLPVSWRVGLAVA